jgi:hypothetical protein
VTPLLLLLLLLFWLFNRAGQVSVSLILHRPCPSLLLLLLLILLLLLQM